MCLHCTALYCTVLCYLHCTGYHRLSLESSLPTCHLAPQILNNKYSPALTGPLGHEELKINPGQSNIATNYKMWGTVTRLEKCTAGILTEKRQSTCFRIVSQDQRRPLWSVFSCRQRDSRLGFQKLINAGRTKLFKVDLKVDRQKTKQ